MVCNGEIGKLKVDLKKGRWKKVGMEDKGNFILK